MGLFGRPKDVSNPLAKTSVWIVPIHLKAGSEQLPPPLVGAYVSVFCRGDDATFAAWSATQAIEAIGYSVPEMPTQAHRMTADQYELYVLDNWPDLKSELPDQAEFYERLAENRAVLGPFAGYDEPTA